jgi:hypothetical protein
LIKSTRPLDKFVDKKTNILLDFVWHQRRLSDLIALMGAIVFI